MLRVMAIIGTLLALFSGPLSASATTLNVASGGDGTVMMAADNDVSGVERIELSFSYPTEFSEPRVSIPGGDYSHEPTINESKPGFLKLAINREEEEILESGFVLIVQFDKKPAGQPCQVISVAAKYFYASGETASPEVNIDSPIEAKKPASAPDAVRAAESRSVKSVAPGPGKIGAISTSLATPAAHVHDGQSGESLNTLEYRVCPDPLQSFRDYRGDGKLSGLLSLFAFTNPCGCRQTPLVAISDGLGKVSLTFETDSAASRESPNYWVTGASFLSLRRDSDKSWTIELLPNQGEHEVVLYILTGRVLKRMPLTVAAPLAIFLDRLKPEEALSPLLEFTIAANYLANHKETAANAGP